MTVVVMVEGTNDHDIVSRVLEDLQPTHPVKIVVANDKNAGRPIARKILLESSTVRLAFVYDSDTHKKSIVDEEKLILESYFGWSSDESKYLVQPMVPEMEVVFFDAPAVVESIVGFELEPAERVAGRYAPKPILLELLKKAKIENLGRFIARLDQKELSELRTLPEFKRLRDFVSGASLN